MADPRNDEGDDRSLEDIQQVIRAELDRIELELSAVLAGEGRLEPEHSLDRFERITEGLESAIHELGESLARLGSVAPVDVNRLASKALQETLVDLEKPLVLRAVWSNELPQPVVPPEPLRSLLARVLSLVGRFSAAGDAVLVTTRKEGQEVVFEVELEPCDPRSTADVSKHFQLRSSSLGEFVSDLGGQFMLREEARTVIMEVRLPVGAPRR